MTDLVTPFSIFTARELRETLRNGSGVECEIAVIGHSTQGEAAVVGNYTRNYPLLRTFAHFRQNGRNLALYAPDYRRTRVMEVLPGGGLRDLGAEPANHDGFCAAEYLVPDVGDPAEGARYPQIHGFVAGWFAQDPSVWVVQYLDLSRAVEGIVARSPRFGRTELVAGACLAEAVDTSFAAATWDHPEGPLFRISTPVGFHVASGRRLEAGGLK